MNYTTDYITPKKVHMSGNVRVRMRKENESYRVSVLCLFLDAVDVLMDSSVVYEATIGIPCIYI